MYPCCLTKTDWTLSYITGRTKFSVIKQFMAFREVHSTCLKPPIGGFRNLASSVKEKIKLKFIFTPVYWGEKINLNIFSPTFIGGEKINLNLFIPTTIEKEGKYILNNDWLPASFSYWYGVLSLYQIGK